MSAVPDDRAAAQRAPALYFPVGSLPRGLAGPYHPLAPGSPGGERVLEIDAEREHYLAAKRAIVARAGRVPGRADGAAADAAVARAEAFVRVKLHEADPKRFDPVQLAGLGLDALMLEAQEDLAVMQLPNALAPARARALYLHVCFPSGWDPARMLGKSFVSLHAHVPYAEGFERAVRAEHAVRLFTEPAVRFVWSLTPEAELDHHPDSARSTDWTRTHEAFLRVERQVIQPLPAAADPRDATDAGAVTLFFIRTYVYPLERLRSAQLRELASAIACMPESVRRYKGLLGHEQRIVELLGAAEARDHARGGGSEHRA
jgi:hypothetical protein